MIAKRPSVFIYTNRPDSAVLKEICAGIEENGVFYEIFERDVQNPQALAHSAANDSMMGAGIGVVQQDVTMQMKGIPYGKTVESLKQPDMRDCRRIGANSARAVKKMPLL